MSSDPLARLMKSLDGQKKPPVHLWNPDFCGDLDIRIDTDGRWYYLGSPIGREKLVKLFASVLRKDEDGKTYLVTPVEKIGITVDDVPFVVTDIDPVDTSDDSGADTDQHAGGSEPAFVLTTNVGDQIILGPDNPLRIENRAEGPRPYVPVRGRLEARINRATYYRMVDMAIEQGGMRDNKLYLISAGIAHSLGDMDDA